MSQECNDIVEVGHEQPLVLAQSVNKEKVELFQKYEQSLTREQKSALNRAYELQTIPSTKVGIAEAIGASTRSFFRWWKQPDFRNAWHDIAEAKWGAYLLPAQQRIVEKALEGDIGAYKTLEEFTGQRKHGGLNQNVDKQVVINTPQKV